MAFTVLSRWQSKCCIVRCWYTVIHTWRLSTGLRSQLILLDVPTAAMLHRAVVKRQAKSKKCNCVYKAFIKEVLTTYLLLLTMSTDYLDAASTICTLLWRCCVVGNIRFINSPRPWRVLLTSFEFQVLSGCFLSAHFDLHTYTRSRSKCLLWWKSLPTKSLHSFNNNSNKWLNSFH